MIGTDECALCNSTEEIVIHHADDGSHVPLCDPCHTCVHVVSEGDWGRGDISRQVHDGEKTIRVTDDVYASLSVAKAEGGYQNMNEVVADIIDLE